MAKIVNSTARVFSKRETEKSAWNGRIGATTFAVYDDGSFTLDDKKLPAQSVTYLMNFALQSLQDAYAGADSLDEATGNWTKKYDALLAGTIGERGSAVDEETTIGRKLVLAALVKKYGKDDVKVTEANAASLDADYAKNKAAFEPLVKQEIARLAEARKAKAAIAQGIGELDI